MSDDMDGWEKLIEAATQTTLAMLQNAARLEEHRRRTQQCDTDLTVEQLRDNVDEFDHAAELTEEVWPDDSIYERTLWPDEEEDDS